MGLCAADKHPKDMDKKQLSSHQIRKELEMTNALKSAMEGIKKDLQQPTETEAAGKSGEQAAAAGRLKNFHVRNFLTKDQDDSPRQNQDVLPEEEEQEAA